ncbi:MAG: hypothetical protein WC767_01605 [Candidatus Paceibacterota bacterium]|jgi:hypothetical protein
MHTTTKKPRIVIVDDDEVLLGRMSEALVAEGIDVSIITVRPSYSHRLLARYVKVCDPDILMVSDILPNSLRGHVLLQTLGGVFNAAVKSPGNPHVISTSKYIPPEFTALIGGMFEAKMDLISAKLEEREGAAQHLVAVVQECIRRLDH